MKSINKFIKPTMRDSSEFNRPQFMVTHQPSYKVLDGSSLQRTLALLMRKGGVLDPPLQRAEAMQLAEFMHLEHFAPGTVISFDAQSKDNGRLMLILAGEATIRMRETAASRSQHSPVDQTSRWATATEGATLGLLHAFSGLSSRFVAQAGTELFVASLSREALQAIKQQLPSLGLRFIEMVAMELALVALDHERSLLAMNNVARSMQNMIDGESGVTRPAPLF
jgi:CRP/FNR family transcriptional regulator, cyclic AMP receptor protein